MTRKYHSYRMTLTMKAKNKKRDSIHDKFVKEILSQKSRRAALLKLALPDSLYPLFNWKTLRTQATTFVTKDGREIRTDACLSAQVKESEKEARILFLIEHKAQKNPMQTLLQLLDYQNTIYQKGESPILPIVIYHGKTRTYKGPLVFQGFLEGYPEAIKKELEGFVLNFGCILLNIHDLAIGEDPKTLPLEPTLFVMKHIFHLDQDVVGKFFTLGRHLSLKERREQREKAADYIRQFDPGFTWETLEAIERKAQSNEEERIMSALKSSLEEAREEGMEKGAKKGRLETLKQIALKMLEKGESLHTIKKWTGLPHKEIEKLKTS